MNTPKLRMAVVGCGYIGHRHMAMIDANDEMELVAVADVRAADICDAPACVPFFSNVDDLLASAGQLDVVSVCTPNGFHADIAIKILKSGANVLMEKPLALSVADARRIADAEKASKGRVFSVFQNRYTPTSQWLKDVVSGGTLGDVTSVVVCCQWNRDERYYKPGSWHGTAALDGGTLFTQFSHYVDILLWIVGEVDILSATFDDFAHKSTTDFEDTGAFIFRTRKSGAIGTFNYTTAVPAENLESSITLIGTKGSVKVAGQYMSDVAFCKIPGYIMPQLPPPNPPNDYGAYKGSAANHCYVFENIADVLLRGAEPTADLSDGMSVVDTIERAYAFRSGNYTSSTPLTYRP